MYLSSTAHLHGLKQVVKELSIINHRLSQILGRGFALPVAFGNLSSRAIVLNYVRMVHGDVRDALLEIRHRVAARLHDFADEPVGFRDGAFGIVHEASLIR